ncbi:MAG: hypothetical protein QOJ19_1829 [Acidimicrobiia bacterium]|nr:hypothetical protein [Acidimicrobiia bacterium]
MSDDGTDVELMIRRAIAGDDTAISWITAQANSSSVPSIVTMAALLEMQPARIDRALSIATTSRDRQVAAIASAHLRGEHQLVDALARDHLVDHPDSVLVAWIASGGVSRPRHRC